jgi:hypothetical protein
LFYAIEGSENGFPEIVGIFNITWESLIKSGSDVNIQDIKGITPLMLASYKGQDDNVEFLLKHKANANIKDSIGSINLWLNRMCIGLRYNGESDKCISSSTRCRGRHKIKR